MKKHLLHARSSGLARPCRTGLLGLVHETNTFEAGCTGYDAFAQPADREPLLRGQALLGMAATRSVMGGMLDVLDALDSACRPQLVPLYRASAAPSALVQGAAWQRLLGEILDSVEQAGPLDALLVELHGAMVADGEDDCEGALLTALRERVGPQCLIVATLDFHANVSPAMVAHADVLVPYRTYPHVDMFETGQRAARRLLACLAMDGRPARAWGQAAFLMPLVGQYTGDGAMARFLQACRDHALSQGLDTAFCGGFPLADTPHAGPSLVVYAPPSQDAMAGQALRQLLAQLDMLRPELAPALLAPREAVAQLDGVQRSILADVADNPGAGCPASNTALLCALHEAGTARSLVATLNRPDWAQAAHAAGLHGHFSASMPGQARPVQLRVLALSDGRYDCTGAMWVGRVVRQGPTARLAWDGVEFIVASQPVQALDPGALACVGVSPEDYTVLSLKSSVHYRAAFGPWAQRILNVDAHQEPGRPVSSRVYRRLRPGVDILS